jgi:hypothetical protein
MPGQDERSGKLSAAWRTYPNMRLSAFGLVARTLLLLVLGLSGCSFSVRSSVGPSALSAWTFHPPKGWKEGALSSGPLIFPTSSDERVWSTQFPPQMLTVTVMGASGPARDTVPFFGKASTITVCRGLQGLFRHKHSLFETVSSDELEIRQDGIAAVARYSYTGGVSPDPQAEASLRSLCPRKVTAGSNRN